MSEGRKATSVYIAIYKRDLSFFSGWTVGCELKRGDRTYFFYSLFLRLSDFENKSDVLSYMIRKILNEIDEEEDTIIFYSPLGHFRNFKRLHEVAEPYKKGRNVRFFWRWYLPLTTHELESDALERGDSVTERLSD